MEGSQSHGDHDPPQVIVSQPTTDHKKSKLSVLKKVRSHEGQSSGSGGVMGVLHRRQTLGSRKKEKHIKIETPHPPRPTPLTNVSSIYMGSYGPTPNSSRPVSIRSPRHSIGTTPRHSTGASQIHLDDVSYLLRDLDLELETYGIQETRDGFFDGVFFKPPRTDKKELMRMAEYTLPASFSKRHPLSISQFFPKQWHELKSVVRRIMTTRAGIRLMKSFLGVFIPYILCLIPVTAEWIGRYRYIMVLSALFNHPDRTVGAQIDGALMTIMGTATGLGWGSVALYVSDSSSIAANGYGGVLAAFLVIFMGSMAAIRSYFIRLYQFAVPGGIAAIFTCLAETGRHVTWEKLLAYGIPWLLGQAICLVVSFTVFPDGGSRQIAVALFNAFEVMQEGLAVPRSDDNVTVYRKLAWTFVNLSQASRDLALDISFIRFAPSDIMEVRNTMQAVVRSLLSIKTKTTLFEDEELRLEGHDSSDEDETVINIDVPRPRPPPDKTNAEDQAVKLVRDVLAHPTSELLIHMREAICRCNAVLVGMSGYRRYIGPAEDVSSDVVGALTSLRKATIRFDKLHEELIHNQAFPATYSNYPDVVELFLFVNPVRQTASSLDALLILVMKLQQRHRGWRFYLPHYPFYKSLQRANAQVRHDRGSLTTGLFFRSQKELNKMMSDARKSTFQPVPRKKSEDNPPIGVDFGDAEDDILPDVAAQVKKTFRYKLWKVLHRLQGFEMRFALKVAIVVSLLSVPAWLNQSKQVYNDYQSWWAVICVWVMIHPRAGANIQDLFTRSFFAALGAIWGGFAYGSRNGNPYVMAVFAAIYLIPMMYRFTQSSHPRSGLIGCVSFIIVSLNSNLQDKNISIVDAAWAHGAAFVVGVVSGILVSWVLWPFVARHELRKSLSAMIYYSALIYRGVVADYIYYEDGQEPTQEDITRSEMLEGRLREAFVRMRHLLSLTRHEIQLREPFNPLPYSALIESCESFFENLVEVRQFSLYFHPNYMSDNEAASEELFPFRRDAVASILMNLYTLAGALRGGRRVPRYLPSAAAARKRLLDHMAEMEFREAEEKEDKKTRAEEMKEERGMRFAQVYQFAYSKGLTQCVEQLEQLQKYTKTICGEVGFDPDDFIDEDYKVQQARKL